MKTRVCSKLELPQKATVSATVAAQKVARVSLKGELC